MIGGSAVDERILDEAIDWLRKLAQDDADWHGFALWLEADPRHRRAFDEISLVDRMADDRAGDLRRILPELPTEDSAAPNRRRLILGSLVAALALAIGIPMALPTHQDRVYATTAGETRKLALGDSAVELAPSSKLIAFGGDATALRLEHGEAFFAVRHDPNRTLSIKAGDFTITDVGTKFAVSLAGDTLRIGVAEGGIHIASDQVDTGLSAGEELFAMPGVDVRKAAVASDDVGSWRRGRLVYKDAPLEIVVADIARFSGRPISLGPKLKGRRFSGVLAIGDGSGLLASLASLMGVSWRVEGNHLRLDYGGAG